MGATEWPAPYTATAQPLVHVSRGFPAVPKHGPPPAPPGQAPDMGGPEGPGPDFPWGTGPSQALVATSPLRPDFPPVPGHAHDTGGQPVCVSSTVRHHGQRLHVPVLPPQRTARPLRAVDTDPQELNVPWVALKCWILISRRDSLSLHSERQHNNPHCEFLTARHRPRVPLPAGILVTRRAPRTDALSQLRPGPAEWLLWRGHDRVGKQRKPACFLARGRAAWGQTMLLLASPQSWAASTGQSQGGRACGPRR